MPAALVQLQETTKLLSVDYDVETANLSQAELQLLDTRRVYLLPNSVAP